MKPVSFELEKDLAELLLQQKKDDPIFQIY